jgi:hypothetical protein
MSVCDAWYEGKSSFSSYHLIRFALLNISDIGSKIGNIIIVVKDSWSFSGKSFSFLAVEHDTVCT